MTQVSGPAAFVVAGMGLAVLWTQFPSAHPIMALFVLILMLGLYLRQRPLIDSQFSSILGWNGKKETL